MATRLGQYRVPLSIGTTAQTLTLLTARDTNIIKACNIVLHNTHAAQTVTLYFGIRRKGLEHWFHYKATLAAGDIELCGCNLYLSDGDALIVNVDGSGAATTFVVCYQLLDEGSE